MLPLFWFYHLNGCSFQFIAAKVIVNICFDERTNALWAFVLDRTTVDAQCTHILLKKSPDQQALVPFLSHMPFRFDSHLRPFVRQLTSKNLSFVFNSSSLFRFKNLNIAVRIQHPGSVIIGIAERSQCKNWAFGMTSAMRQP